MLFWQHHTQWVRWELLAKRLNTHWAILTWDACYLARIKINENTSQKTPYQIFAKKEWIPHVVINTLYWHWQSQAGNNQSCCFTGSFTTISFLLYSNPSFVSQYLDKNNLVDTADALIRCTYSANGLHSKSILWKLLDNEYYICSVKTKNIQNVLFKINYLRFLIYISIC